MTLSAADLITLTRTSTITDRDGDTASDSAVLNIGTALSFEDDGPSIDVTSAGEGPVLTVDETDLAQNASASFAGSFSATSSFGTDGAGTLVTSYGLNVKSQGVDSGLDDVASGQNVLLFLESGQVVGRAGSVSGEIVFTLTVDADGNVTLDQRRAVAHDVDGSSAAAHDDAMTLSAADLITLTRTSTITDRDGDTASDSAVLNIGTALSFEDDGPAFTIVNDGPDAGTTVSISTPNPATTTTYVAQFADWKHGADLAQGTPTLSNVSGSGAVTINAGASTSDKLVLELKDATGTVVATLTLNADGTDSIQVVHRATTFDTDLLLTGDVTASGPELTKFIQSTISGLTITVTASDGDENPNEGSPVVNNNNDDEVNPSTQGWAVADNQIDSGESITFSFSVGVERFSFVADGFTGNPSDSSNDADTLPDVGLTIRVYYNPEKTIHQDFTVTVNEGASIQVADLPGFGSNGQYTSFYGVTVLSDSTQDNNDGFRLNNVTVSKVTANPPTDLDYSFTVNLTDKDGDTASQSFTVHLDSEASGGLLVEAIAGTSGADTLNGTGANDVLIGGGGDDILIGGAGSDTLTGGDGSDTFRYQSLSDGLDSITDFTIAAPASGGDVLNLQDVLAVAGATIDNAVVGDDATTVDNYVYFTVSGTTATLFVDTAGGGSGTALATFSVASGTTADGLLQQLLQNNQIVT